MRYDPKDFTWGFELEVSDTRKATPIPENLGKWENAECDIVNTLAPYRGVCQDPRGINPPVGGEINTRPTKTIEAQVAKIMAVVEHLRSVGEPVNVGPTAHGHIHCFVPGLKQDLDAIKRLVAYIKVNQADVVKYAYGFRELPEMVGSPKGKTYLKLDGGRQMPEWMCDNIINMATSFDHLMELYRLGKTGVKIQRLLRPYRYAVNIYSLKQLGTVEFRCFRASLDSEEIYDTFRFARDFMDAALNDGPSVFDLVMNNDYKFPPMQWDYVLMKGWETTNHYVESSANQVKNRELLEAE